MNKNTVNPERINIIERGPLPLIGCVFYGDPFHSKGGWDVENEIGLTWKRFMSLYEKNKDVIERYRVNTDTAYEVHIQPEDYEETKKFYVYVGVEVKTLDEIPLEMFGKVFPQTMYAVFTFKGRDIFRGGKYIWQQWLPTSEYEEAYPYLILAYDERFRGLDNEESEIDYHVPIRLKGGDNK
ncbi:MAG: GyrI-like domain-containing protein [Theionarchaea archaeon]|nr:GyrI-like domain-containing protein [Theionarchaea archaeon]